MVLNLKFPVDLTRLLLPSLLKNKGTIIYTVSRAAAKSLPWTTSYNASKTALLRFAGTLHAEYKDQGLKVYSMHPGEVETELHSTAFPEKTKRETPEVYRKIKEFTGRSKHSDPEVPAWTAVWLASGKGEVMRGRYLDASKDVGELVARSDEIMENGLYELKVDELS
jgi:short-subunit dehydrogenase